MNYQDAIQNLSTITKAPTGEQLEVIFYSSTEIVRFIVAMKYSRLDRSDAEDIANEVSISTIEKFKSDPTFEVLKWPSYLELKIKEVFKKEYKYYGKLQSIHNYDEDRTDDEIDELVSVEIDTDTIVDLKRSVESVYLLLQKIVSTIPIISDEVKLILERIIVYAVTIDESIIDTLPETYKRIVRARYGILRHVLNKNKDEGLLVSRNI